MYILGGFIIGFMVGAIYPFVCLSLFTCAQKKPQQTPMIVGDKPKRTSSQRTLMDSNVYERIIKS